MHKLTAGVLSLLMFASCGQVKNIAYFQDKALDHPEEIDKHGGIVIQPKDMISIVVSSRNPELSTMFNLPVVSYQAGSEIVTSAAQQRLLGYVVDNDGYIDFPVLGTMKVDKMGAFRIYKGHSPEKRISQRCSSHCGIHELQGIGPRRSQPSGHIHH